MFHERTHYNNLPCCLHTKYSDTAGESEYYKLSPQTFDSPLLGNGEPFNKHYTIQRGIHMSCCSLDNCKQLLLMSEGAFLHVLRVRQLEIARAARKCMSCLIEQNCTILVFCTQGFNVGCFFYGGLYMQVKNLQL